jgi:hypothetical protein
MTGHKLESRAGKPLEFLRGYSRRQLKLTTEQVIGRYGDAQSNEQLKML